MLEIAVGTIDFVWPVSKLSFIFGVFKAESANNKKVKA